MPKRSARALKNFIAEKRLFSKILRVLLKDVVWMALFYAVIRGHLIERLTIRNGFYVAALFLALYSIFQLALCGRAYLESYREAIRGSVSVIPNT